MVQQMILCLLSAFSGWKASFLTVLSDATQPAQRLRDAAPLHHRSFPLRRQRAFHPPVSLALLANDDLEGVLPQQLAIAALMERAYMHQHDL